MLCTKRNKKFELKKEILSCESLQTTAAATDIMNVIKDFFEKHIFLEKIGCWYHVCTDGAVAIPGCKLGCVDLKKHESKLNCILHRYALMSKILPDNSKEVIDSVVHIANFI